MRAAGTPPSGTWETFRSGVAEIADVPSNSVGQDTRLIGDLGMDSVALTELVTMLVDDFDIPELAHQLADNDWGTVTVGEVFHLHFGSG